MFSIGEFSRITGLSVKAIHLYHEKGLLVPAQIDAQTGYRYFNSANVEQARTIRKLRELSFSLEEIKTLLQGVDDDMLFLDVLMSKRQQVLEQLAHLKGTAKMLESIIASEKEARAMAEINSFKVEEKDVPAVLVVS
ncbi:MAG TPA: MerR family transcriptional regulator, partial [Candidatus Angelobacter sp.]